MEALIAVACVFTLIGFAGGFALASLMATSKRADECSECLQNQEYVIHSIADEEIASWQNRLRAMGSARMEKAEP